MTSNKLQLVYSVHTPTKNDEKSQNKSLIQSEQLGLFDDFTAIKIIFVPVADISSHSFKSTIKKNEPYLLLDTREYPDFFSIFISTTSAMTEFEKQGIQYCRLPIVNSTERNISPWEQLNNLKEILDQYLEKRTNAPIMVLSSTKYKLDKISEKLIGFIQQEITDVKFEKITE
ncbi:TPA: hypothetical protein U2I29_000505 [Providencia rettgeri]|nr:hypothetical protein [Providencia rettgeri]